MNLYAKKNEQGEPIILEGGRITLKDIESKKKFDEEISKLRNLEIEDIVRVELSEKDFADSSKIPTPSELLALESVIDFKEE